MPVTSTLGIQSSIYPCPIHRPKPGPVAYSLLFDQLRYAVGRPLSTAGGTPSAARSARASSILQLV